MYTSARVQRPALGPSQRNRQPWSTRNCRDEVRHAQPYSPIAIRREKCLFSRHGFSRESSQPTVIYMASLKPYKLSTRPPPSEYAHFNCVFSHLGMRSDALTLDLNKPTGRTGPQVELGHRRCRRGLARLTTNSCGRKIEEESAPHTGMTTVGVVDKARSYSRRPYDARRNKRSDDLVGQRGSSGGL